MKNLLYVCLALILLWLLWVAAEHSVNECNSHGGHMVLIGKILMCQY